MFEWFTNIFKARNDTAALPVIQLQDLLTPNAPSRWKWDDGERYAGGYGLTNILIADYWTLRLRSAELFETNLYARGLIRRLVTNEINTGLELEAMPQELILGQQQDALADWSEDVETRFHLWAMTPKLCDYNEQETFGGLQAKARQEALVAGDVLVVLHQDRRTGLPRIQLVNGSSVGTPMANPRRGNTILHGVEIDKQGRHQAYWILQDDMTYKRLPAWGEKSGRRLAWMIYGTDKRLDHVRGRPMLSLIMQSLKEVDRYRDAALRKAVLNSMLAMFIKKDGDKMGTKPITGGAVRKGTGVTTDSTGVARNFNVAELMPGTVIDELAPGEEPQGFHNQGTDEKFGEFEEAMIQTVAWANEIPPEILRLAFSNNYSASQAAINEFKMYLNRFRTQFGSALCARVYEEWLLSETLQGKVPAPGLLEAWRDPAAYDQYTAWVSSDWSGHIKPSTDIFKQARGYEILVANGWISNDRASRELTGTKFSQNIKKLRTENEQKKEVNDILEPPEMSEEDMLGVERFDDPDNEDRERTAALS